MRYVKYILHMSSVTGKKYGLPSLPPNNPRMDAIVLGIEELFSNLLGIQQLSVAMRRSPDKIEEFINRWDGADHPVIEKNRNGKGPNCKYCFDSSILMLAHNVMNKKQFEQFYWPHMKELLDAYAEKGMNIRIFTECSIFRFAEYFKDYPEGTLTFHLEQDDPFAFREALPNVAIMGGMTTDLLSNGTPEECVAYAERLCDELGAGGCRICKKCAYPEPCRFPEKRMSSMKGYGLFVTQVCRDVGVPYYYGERTITYFACILY